MKRDILLICGALVFWTLGTVTITRAGSNTIVADEVQIINLSQAELNRLEIKSLNIEVGIRPGGLKGDKWLMSEKSALYWKENQKIVVYGHNSQNIFANLGKAVPGEEIKLIDSLGKEAKYKIVSVETINQSEVERVTGANGDLVVMTCTGWWDEKRILVIGQTI